MIQQNVSLRIKVEDITRVIPDLTSLGMTQIELEEVVAHVNSVLQPSFAYKIYNKIELSESYIKVNDIDLQCGNRITKSLAGSQQIAVFACCAGEGVSELYRSYSSECDLMNGYVCDVLGNIAVGLCLEQLQHHLTINGDKTTSNFSPGYCSWDIKEQRAIFSLLDPNPCGIELSESCLMTPTKSLSGIIGIGKSVIYVENRCKVCKSKRCIYRQQG